jgi:hypothetical protein
MVLWCCFTPEPLPQANDPPGSVSPCHLRLAWKIKPVRNVPHSECFANLEVFTVVPTNTRHEGGWRCGFSRGDKRPSASSATPQQPKTGGKDRPPTPPRHVTHIPDARARNCGCEMSSTPGPLSKPLCVVVFLGSRSAATKRAMGLGERGCPACIRRRLADRTAPSRAPTLKTKKAG